MADTATKGFRATVYLILGLIQQLGKNSTDTHKDGGGSNNRGKPVLVEPIQDMAKLQLLPELPTFRCEMISWFIEV